MKKTFIRARALCLVAVMLSTALVSCGGKLNGTYVNNTFGLTITYTFSGKEWSAPILEQIGEIKNELKKMNLVGRKIKKNSWYKG